MTELPPDQPIGTLNLTIQGNVLTRGVVTPTVLLNGYGVLVKHGENVLPLPAGRWRIDVVVPWLRRFGQATTEFDIAPGQTVPVFYAAPMHALSDGSIGHEKQRRKGFRAFVVTMAPILALIIGLTLWDIL